MSEITEKKYTVPMVALRGLTVMPNMVIHFDLSREMSIKAVEQALNEGQKVFLVAQKDPGEDMPTQDSLYEIGTVAWIKQVTKLPNQISRVMVEGWKKARLVEIDEQEDAYMRATVEEIEIAKEELEQQEEEALIRSLKDVFATYVKFFPKVGKSLGRYFNEKNSLDFLINQVAINTPFSYEQKQSLLEVTDLREQATILITMLMNEAQVASIRAQLAAKVKEKIDKHQREYVLREQMSVVREELGDKDPYSDIEQFEQALEKLKADKEVKDKIRKQIARFKNVMGASSEGAVERTYIETLLEMPWNKASKDMLDMHKSEMILDRDHYGMEKVKERILEYLAVRSLTSNGDAPIVCLVGPPGTGKTSIARSIAESLNRKYVRICLGGVRDEAEIRGHRRTYIGAMPGRIANGIKEAGVCNPLMLLDEIDKVSSDHKGDTSSALLEVLDPEQNCHFRDHYIEIPLDLSKVLFIATANDASSIPRPLLDRMDIIEVESYTANEKYHIAKKHLISKQFEKNGIKQEQLVISDGALRNVIAYYTKEAGVRGLERQIGKLCRKAARQLVENKDKKLKVNSQNLEKYLGKPKVRKDKANEMDDIGIVRGLAWTSVGGDTLQIEVNVMPGEGKMELTGKLGDVMKESARIGLSYIRSIASGYSIDATYFKEHDFHIHIPEGAVPKDGPSAGITMATAIFSAITKIPVKCKVAMTGEITLRGRVLPIGGLKEKMLAAKMAGIETVLVPFENERDVDEISKEIKAGLEICYMHTMDEVLEKALVSMPMQVRKDTGKRKVR
ncbi:MAG: endopeptidase La [Lachnospiraceae bacterium]|nr:endopeptidase La [Lachnospiraceae bacterium]MEE1256772.1 endopeptidase La [Lachnospiraceae bacterium]